MNIKKWLNEQIRQENKKPIPLLFYPCAELLGMKVSDLLSDSDAQARGLKAIADKYDVGALVRLAELWVEAEAFGAKIIISENNFPVISGKVLSSIEDVDMLEIPEIGAGHTGIFIEAIKKACSLVIDRPIFAGMTGPFSLCGCLMDITEMMMSCYDDPHMTHKFLGKVTDFLIRYCKAYKNSGAAGVIMAEPSSSMLSPDLMDEFSNTYINKIIDEVQDDNFIIIYHNCGNIMPHLDAICRIKAAGYHFGDAVDMAEVLEKVSEDVLVMGNISPLQFKSGTPKSIRKATLHLLNECGKKPNFIISSGCDIPPLTPWENIDSFIETVNEFYPMITCRKSDNNGSYVPGLTTSKLQVEQN